MSIYLPFKRRNDSFTIFEQISFEILRLRNGNSLINWFRSCIWSIIFSVCVFFVFRLLSSDLLHEILIIMLLLYVVTCDWSFIIILRPYYYASKLNASWIMVTGSIIETDAWHISIKFRQIRTIASGTRVILNNITMEKWILGVCQAMKFQNKGSAQQRLFFARACICVCVSVTIFICNKIPDVRIEMFI